MTNDSTPRQNTANDQPETNGHSNPPIVEAHWEKPLVAASGGEATLLVRIIAATEDDTETSRATPLDVAFVLDRSGSMRGGKLALAKEGVDLAVTRLRDADRTALVVYDDEVDTVQPLAPATPRLKASLRLALHGVDPGGSTYLSGGWIAGCHQLAEATPVADADSTASRIRRVILLTDGLANVGILDPGVLGQHAGELRRRGIATTTVGVGQDFDEGLLSAMAEAGGGNFQYVAGPEGLRAFFAHELQELFSVAATGLTVTLVLPPGVDAELVSAFPLETRGNALEVAIGDLPAGDEIDLVFTLRAGYGNAGDLLPVGLTACWTDPRADARRELNATLNPLRRAEAPDVMAATPDDLVVERSALQRAAAERRAGLELDRAGRYVESRARMLQSRAYLAAAPMTPLVENDLAMTEELASAPATSAYGSHARKSAQLREDQRRRGRQAREPRFDEERR
jgi:Ca-activated chloride channel family protein